MKENYKVTISGNQMLKMHNQNVSLTTFGDYSEKNGVKYITYTEYDDEFPDLDSLSIITILNKNNIILSKIGKIKTNMTFEQGKRHYCYYTTEYGSLTLGIFTSKIDFKLDKSGGTLNIQYYLDVEANLIGMCNINIKLEEKQKNVEKINRSN